MHQRYAALAQRAHDALERGEVDTACEELEELEDAAQAAPAIFPARSVSISTATSSASAAGEASPMMSQLS